MRVRLDQVRHEPFHWQETVDIPAAELRRVELEELGPVTWRGQVTWAEPGYLLRARLAYEQTLVCDRCLKPTPAPVASDVELAIFVAPPGGATGEHELHEDDMGVVYVPEEVLETDPILREQLQLNIPMKPLCRPDCAGLCPTCGADLNLVEGGRCGCPEPAGDPRFAALAVLRDRLNEKE
jgi:DUF177 domain-containing protein